MENKINQILELDNNKKFMVLKQFVYKKETYLMLGEVDEDETKILDNFSFVKEIAKDGETYLEPVDDPETDKILLEHIGV